MDDARGDLIFVIIFIIVLGIVWSLTGGPDRSISREGPFLNPPFPLGDETAYRVPGVDIPDIQRSKSGGSDGAEDKSTLSQIISRLRSGFASGTSRSNSPYAGQVELSRASARDDEPEEEYITLKTRSVDGRITISDWRIESGVSLLGSKLGEAAYLPFSGRVNHEDPVALGSNETVHIVTGRSPIGTSFRLNTCTGYFEQFQDFEPRISKRCPLPEDELRDAIGARGFVPNETCIDFIEDIDRCELTLTTVPSAVGGTCQSFILEDLTYSGCVDAHKNETDFYQKEWRLYLGRDQELWRDDDEVIQLLDENGLVVDSISY